MKPLIVLVVAFLVAIAITKIGFGMDDWRLPARIAMACMLCFTSIAHFIFTKGMMMMIPPFVPNRAGVVYASGVLEILAAIALLIPGLSVMAGSFLLSFFILLLPANIYAALQGVDYQRGTTDGPGKKYLWFRVPLQCFFIAWVYFSTIGGGG